MSGPRTYLIDIKHVGIERGTGCWLLAGSEPLLVDPGPEPCIETLLAGMDRLGVSGDDLQALLLTHIHLDHAGAAGSLVERFPHLKVYVHERGAPHLIDPERLLQSAARLYGDRMTELWGEIVPLPWRCVIALEGGERLTFGERTIAVEYTPGHASHHVSFFDRSDGAAYTGDVAGMKLHRAGFVIPPTPPPDIDIELWLASIDRIDRRQPSSLRIAHYGQVDSVGEHLDVLKRRLRHWSEVARGLIEGGSADPVSEFAQAVRADLLAEGASREDVVDYVDRSNFSAQQQWLGLERYWRSA